MPSRRSIIIATIIGVSALVALSLFVINSLVPIKLTKPAFPLLNLPESVVKTSPQASGSGDTWKLPEASPSGESLFLVIVNPGSGLVSPATQIKVSGQTSTTAKLTLNERILTPNPDGSFSIIAALTPGENEFVVTAYNKEGEEKTETSLVLNAMEEEGSKLTIVSSTGVITAVNGNNFSLATSRGETLSTEVSGITKFLRKYGAEIGKDTFVIGNEIEVVGVGNEALLFRNLSETTHNAYVTGQVTKVTGTDLIINTLDGKAVTVVLAGAASATFSPKVGDTIYVFGLYDPRSGRVTGVKTLSEKWN